ncbi:MAG: long-chain fatty acid--CoA ligase [SAR324 cluster bacterium]|nr:long-chain fatty acid--CoA ligase [SAR324 cluster bacterium]
MKMKFIGQFADTLDSQSNMLMDGVSQCTYHEIPDIFDKIETCLTEKNINNSACLAFECENSVPGALVLLYLLEKGYSFLLIPQTSLKLSLPGFCHYRLRTESVPGQEQTDYLNPERFLRVFPNDGKNGTAHAGAQKLYMRTSGSTGSPKMAVHAHARLQENVLNCVRRLELNSNDRIAIPVPVFHMYGLGAAFLPAIAVNASIDLQKGANILRYLQREKEFNPNVVFMTPIFCETLVKGRKSPRTYKLTVTAGDRFRGEVFSQYEALCGRLVQLYGSTEMGAIAASSPDTSFEFRAKTAGTPMPNVQMRMEKIAESTDIGELWCRHQSGFEGYVDENGGPIDLGQELREGWFRTKDFGRIWQEQQIEVLGRCDHSVNRDGLLVFFADVEKALETIAGIDSAVVVSKGESQRGKNLVAYCVLSKNIEMTEKDIRTACFDLLSRNAIPDQIILVKSLPLLANGKVDRQQLIHS